MKRIVAVVATLPGTRGGDAVGDGRKKAKPAGGDAGNG
jgi:hypothetical protein